MIERFNANVEMYARSEKTMERLRSHVRYSCFNRAEVQERASGPLHPNLSKSQPAEMATDSTTARFRRGAKEAPEAVRNRYLRACQSYRCIVSSPSLLPR